MHEIGLYHPRIHFPSDEWIKVAALYWTKMARIAPSGYIPRDSDTVRALQDELDFIVDINPPAAVHRFTLDTACFEFYKFVADNHIELRRRYGTEREDFIRYVRELGEFPFGFESWDDQHGEPCVAEVANVKFAKMFRDSLAAHHLAVAGPRRHSFETSSLLMHPDLARVYMSALAEDIARANHLRPTTNDHDAFAVGTGWTDDRMRNLLLPDAESQRPSRKSKNLDLQSPSPDVIGMIAIQAVIPSGIDQVPTKKIIKIRERFAGQFTAFRDTVDTVANEIATDLETVQDPAIVRAYLEQEVHERLLVPAKELRHAMHQMKIDTATATLTFKYEVPALASLAASGVLAHEPLLAGGAAVAVGLLSLVQGAQREAAHDRDSSPVSYLMILHDHLGAHSTLHRTARQIRKITGLS